MGIPLSLRTTTKLAAAIATALACTVAPAGAFDGIENTGPGTPPGPGLEGYGHVAGSPTVLSDHIFAVPFDPADASEAAAADALWSTGTPENDLGVALDRMAAADTAAEAAAARTLALSILEGRPLDRKAYSGIPLLNYDTPAKVKHVPANGTVVITQVRWGEHMISDTSMLEFADPDQPFSIKYRVAELGSAFGGQLNPTPLLQNDAQQVGQHSAVQPLVVEGNLPMGTTQKSRFTTKRNLGSVPEQTRSAMQEITVDMPPAGMVTAILDPNLRPGHETATTLMPASAERVDAARTALGYQEPLDSGRPSAGDRARAIGRLAATAPEKQIWQALQGLPAEGDDGFLAAAKAAGQGNRILVSAMRSRSELPDGVVPDPGADATIVLQNNEAYLARRSMRLSPGAQLRVQVVNRDGFAHDMTAFDLHGRDRIFGAEDWGAFSWDERDLASGGDVPAGASRTFTLTPADDAFAVWLGDAVSGDQSHAVIELDRSAHKQQALKFGAGTLPVHSMPDAQGNVWVTLAGVDTIARIKPAADLGESVVERFPLPGGKHEVDSAVAPLGPADIAVDGRGIIWVTLASGNALARIDPQAVENGSDNGITKILLDPCTENPECLPEVPPVPNELPTRRPTRLKTMIDGQGHTVLWFAEAGASSVGVLRVTEGGSVVNQTHFPCGCLEIETVDLGPDGSVWFTEIFENRIGRLRPDRTRPYSASAVQIDHYKIPGSALVPDPLIPEGVQTSLPFSLAVDGRGRVWFSESSLGGVAYLDPAQAVPNTTQGITELEMPGSDFRSPAAPNDVAVDRANNFWWAGEYGDQIEQLRPDASQGLRFRGSVRRGITEGPVPDVNGNLWVVETGGNVITRISGVTEGPLVPFGAPAGYEADITQDRVSGARLRDTTSVDVRVRRGGTVVASATVPVSGGSFDVSGAAWSGTAADRIRPDDTVLVQPNGPFARAELSFRVADLTATIGAGGEVTGQATVDDNALADRVSVTGAGTTLTSGINGTTGAWRVVLAEDVTGGTVSWSGATVAGSFRTVLRFGSEPQPQPQPQTGGGSSNAQSPAAVTPAPAPAPAPKPQTGPSKTAAPAECRNRTWLFGTARRPRLLLLGQTADQTIACLGTPVRRTAARGKRLEAWTYADGTIVRFSARRVAGITLRKAGLRSSRGRVGVGSKLRDLKKVLPGLRRDARTGAYRARVGTATVKVSVDRAAKIRIIEVSR